MPKTKTVCVRSTVFQVCQDELVTELLRGLPIKDWCDLDRVLWHAHAGATKRLADGNRHTKGKIQLFFRHMVERLPEVSPSLAVNVGLANAADLEVPDIGVEEPQDLEAMAESIGNPGEGNAEALFAELAKDPDFHVPNNVAAINRDKARASAAGALVCLCDPLTNRPGVLPCPMHSGDLFSDDLSRGQAQRDLDVAVLKDGGIDLHAELPISMLKLPKDKLPKDKLAKDDDEFEHMLDELPTFADYEAVFSMWPYINKATDRSGQAVLVLGYLSGRDGEDRLIRRNCEYQGKSFKYIQSSTGLLKKRLPNGTRLHIKVIPYQVEAKARFWTNVAGEGDRDGYNRYVVCGPTELIELPTRMEYDAA